jgi:hypothetical protein
MKAGDADDELDRVLDLIDGHNHSAWLREYVNDTLAGVDHDNAAEVWNTAQRLDSLRVGELTGTANLMRPTVGALMDPDCRRDQLERVDHRLAELCRVRTFVRVGRPVLRLIRGGRR